MDNLCRKPGISNNSPPLKHDILTQEKFRDVLQLFAARERPADVLSPVSEKFRNVPGLLS
jgi:hypothetical protein